MDMDGMGGMNIDPNVIFQTFFGGMGGGKDFIPYNLSSYPIRSRRL